MLDRRKSFVRFTRSLIAFWVVFFVASAFVYLPKSPFANVPKAMAASVSAFPGKTGDTADTSYASLDCTDNSVWDNAGTPGFASSSDGQYIGIDDANLDSGNVSDELFFSTFDFSSIPANATIDGVVVEIERHRGTGGTGTKDAHVMLTTTGDGVQEGNDKPNATAWASSDPNSYSVSYGASNDTWGATGGLTAAEVKSAGFGVILCVTTTTANTTVFVDALRITVHYTVPTYTVSGTVYQTDKTTPLASKTVNLRKNGTLAGTGAGGTGIEDSDGSGNFSFTGLTMSAGDTLTLYLDGETEKANTITITSSGADVTGVPLYDDHVVIRSDNGAITILDLLDHDSTQDDTNMLFNATDASPDTLVVEDGVKLFIHTGDTFTPGGSVTTSPSADGTDSNVDGDLEMDGTATLSMGTNALSVGGDYLNEGTFSKSTGQTTTFTATATGHTITDGGENFDSVTFNGSNGGWSFADSTTIDVDVNMTAGTLSGTVDITVNGGDVTGDGDINITGGTFLVDTAGNFGGATAWDFNNLTFGNGSGATTTTSTGAGNITVTGVLTIAASQTLDIKGRTWTLQANNLTPLIISGVLDDSANTSTIAFTGNYDSDNSFIAASTAYHNITINNGSETFELGGTVTMSGDLTVTAGTLADTDNVTVNGGDVTGNGDINMTGGTFTVDTAGDFGGDTNWDFNNLQFGDGSGATTTTAIGTGSISVAGSMTVKANQTLNAGGKTWNINGTSGGTLIPAFVQSASNISATTSGSTFTATFGSNVTAGNAVVVYVFWANETNTLSSITGCWSGGATLVNNPTTATGAGVGRAAMGYVSNVTGGSCTITATFASNVNDGYDLSIMAHEVSNITASSPSDGSALRYQDSPSPDGPSSGDINTTTDGDYIFAATNDIGYGSNSTQGSGFITRINGGTSDGHETEDQVQTSAGTINGAFNSNNEFAEFLTGAIALKAASSAAPLTVETNGVFTAASSTVVFAPPSSTSLTIPALTYNNLTFNSSSSTFTPAGNITLNGDMVVTVGTLAGTSNVTVNGGDVTGNGDINMTGGTFTVDTASATGFGGDTDWDFNNLQFGDGSGATTTTAIGTGSITVAGGMTVKANQTLNAGGKTWNLNGTGGAGQVTLTNKDNNVSTSDPTTTASISWTAGSRGLVAVAHSCTVNPCADGVDIAVTGGSVTWNQLNSGLLYSLRRELFIFLSDGTPANGTLSIASVGETYQELQYSVDQITGFNTSDVDDPVQTNTSTTTSLNLPDLGTIDSGDLVYAAFGFEAATDNLAPASGLNTHVLRQNGGNVRSLLVGYSTTDDTPGITWSTNGNGAGGVGVIINAGADTSPLTIETNGVFTAASSTVVYKGNADLTIPNVTYNHLTFNPTVATSGKTYTFSGAVTIGGDFNINPTAGSALNLNVALAGTTAVTGTLTIQKASSATSSLNTGANYALTAGDITIASGGTLTANSSTVTVNDDWANSGTFTACTCTVALATTSTATITGTTNFYNFNITSIGAAKTVQFEAGVVFGFTGPANSVTVTGTSGNLITITSTTTAVWLADFTNTQNTLTYVFLQHSGCSSSAVVTMDATSTNDATATINDSACWSFPGGGITVSGTVYQTDRSTTLASKTVHLRKNGTLAGTGATSTGIEDSDGSGNFSFIGLTVNAGDTITLYLDAETEKANTITISAGSGDITTVPLYDDHVVIRSDNGATAITIPDLWDYDSTQDDTNMLFNATDAGTDTLVIENGVKLQIHTGDTFTPGGTVTTDPSSDGTDSNVDGDVELDGTATLNMGTNSLSVGGDYLNEGTFSKSTNQVITFTATATGHTITDGGENFEYITFNGINGGWSFADSTILDGDLTILSGSLSGTVDITVNGGAISSCSGCINLTGGTFLLDGTGNFFTLGDNTFYNVVFGDGSVSTTTTDSGTGNITVSNTLVIADNQTFDIEKTWILSGTTGTPLTITGILDDASNASTIKFTGNAGGNTTIPASTAYHNITLDNASETFVLGGTVTMSGSLAVTSGTLQDTDNLTVNGGGFTGDGTVTFSGSSTVTIDGAGNFGGATGWTFNNLIFGNGSGATTSTSTGSGAIAVNGSLTIAAEQILDAKGKTWTLSATSSPLVVSGTFDDSANSSTFIFTGNANLTIPNVAYHHLTFSPTVATDGKSYSLDTGAWSLSGNLDINPTAGSALNLSVILGANTTIAGSVTIQKTSSATSSLSTNGSNYSLEAASINIATGGTLTINDSNVTITGSGTPFTPTGTFNVGTNSTFIYNSTSATNIAETTYNHLSLTPGGTPTYTLGTAGSQTINVNNLTIGNGSNGVAVNHATWDPALNITGNLSIAASAGTFTKSDAGTPAVITLKPAGTKTWSDATNQDIGVVVIGSGTSTPRINLSTAVKVSSLNLNSSHILDVNGTNTITITGSGAAANRPFIEAGTFTPSSGTVAFTGTSATEIESTDYNHLSLIPAGTPTYTLGTAGSQTINVNDLTIGNGAQAVAVNHATYDPILNIAGNFTIAASAGTFTKSDSPATITLKPTSTKTWSDATNQDIGVVVIGSGASTPKINLGSSVKATSINIDGSHTLDFNGANTLTVTSNSTPFTITGTLTDPTGTIAFVPSSSGTITVPVRTYNAVTFDGSGSTFRPGSGSLNIGSTLTITNGTLDLNTSDPTTVVTGNISNSGILDAPSANSFTFLGNFTNNGTFNHNTGTVVVTPSGSSSTINGSTSTTTFNNLTMNGQAGKTLQFKAGNTYAFGGTLTVSGTQNSYATLRSDSGGSQWVINLSGTAALSFLNLQDAGCHGSTITVTLAESVQDQGGNGACWAIIRRSGGVTGGGDGSSGGGGGGISGGGQGGGSGLAIHASTPARVDGTSVSSVTTASFDAPANSLLLAVVHAKTGVAENENVTLTMSNNGGALTWTVELEREPADDPGWNGYVGIAWTWLSAARSGMTVTADPANTGLSDNAQIMTIKLYVISGADTVDPIGASGEGNSNTNNLSATLYTSTVNNSLGFGGATDSSQLGVPSSTDIEDTFTLDSSSTVGMSAYKATVTPTSGTSVSMNFDAADEGIAIWNWVGIEVKPMSDGGSGGGGGQGGGGQGGGGGGGGGDAP